jgi:hypothetical protein
MSPNFRAMGDGIGHMRYQCAGFGSNLASLEAKPAVDAMRSVTMRSGKNCDRAASNGSNTEVRTTTHQNIAHAS